MKRSYAQTFPPGDFRAKRTGPLRKPFRRDTAIAKIPGETKYFDCDRSSNSIVAVTTTWGISTRQDPGTTINLGSAAVATPLCLFAPTVGAALNQRIGRAVQMMKCKINGAIAVPAQAAAAAADATTRIRVILVLDTQTNAAQLLASDLLNDGTSANTVIGAFQNPNNFGRFQVLKDKTYSIANPNMAGSPTTADVIQGGLIIPFKINYNFKKPIKVQFNATNGGTVADIIDNSLHFIIACENIALAPTIQYYSRVSYKEL